MSAEIIKFPGRKVIRPATLRIPDQHKLDIEFKVQTLEEIEAEIMLQELDDAIRVVLREEGLIE